MEALEWTQDLNFNHSLIISLVIHVVLITILPGIAPRSLPLNPYIEINLLPPPPPKPVEPSKPPVVEKPTLAGAAGKKFTGGKKAEAWQWRPLPAAVKSDNTAKAGREDTVPMVDLPAKSQASDKQPDILKIPDYPAIPAEEVGGRVSKLPPSLSIAGGAIGVADISQGIGNSGAAGGKGDSPGSGLVFDWIGKPRRTLYEPAKPRYSSAVEGTVEAKIWVDADGHVTNAMVTKKLDAVLEQLALNYIKQCRFEPLKVKDDKLQTGIAKFYFKLE